MLGSGYFLLDNTAIVMPRETASMSNEIKVKTSMVVIRSPPFGVDRALHGGYYTIIRRGCKRKKRPLDKGCFQFANDEAGRCIPRESTRSILTKPEKSVRLTRENLRDIIKAKKVAARCNGRSPPIIVIVEERPRYYLGCGYFFNVRFKTPKTTVAIKVRSA